MKDAIHLLKTELSNKEILINREYRVSGVDFVTMQYSDTKSDVAKYLISQGLALAEGRREKIFHNLVSFCENLVDL